ncbi:MAG: AAA family ATPase, partial [Magnetococcales bacterium]|nr:AAA family ATPase [Magnetococcales bacterium]
MKILAIRGENLASLAKPFHVELQQPPLVNQGLYAITGPTGAGKSTLLDALCLALFDAIPRLGTGRGTLVGRVGEGEESWINSTDVRTILRRGAVHGWAEVEFIGVDQRLYRAKWEVRRAYRKANGALQPQSMELWDVSEQRAFPGKRGEIREAIRQKLGLDFDQFRRSVFLSQGEFAAFLKSDAKQRGDLLEQITGATLYGRISQLAWQRASQENKNLKALEEQLATTVPLTPQAREILEATRLQLLTQKEGMRQEREGLTRWFYWHQQQEQLLRQWNQSQKEHEQAETNWLAAELRRENYQKLLAVQPLRPVVAAWEAARQNLQQAEGQLAELSSRRSKLEASRLVLQTSQQQGQQAWNRQEIHWQEVQQQLGIARELDVRCQEATRALSEVVQQQKKALAEKDNLEKLLQDAQARLQQLQKSLDDHQSWLSRHTHLQPLFEQWPRWSAEFSRYEQGRRNRDALDKSLHQAGEEWFKLQELRQQSSWAVQEGERKLAALEEEQIAELRHYLRPGEPCPVCGAQEHPWAEQRPQGEHLLNGQQVRGEKQNKIKAELEKARENLASLEQKMARVEQQRAVAEHGLVQAEAGCQEILTLLTPAMAGISQWQERFVNDHQRWHRQLDGLNGQWQERMSGSVQLGQQIQQQEQGITHAQESLQKSRLRLSELEQQCSQRKDHRDTLVQQRQGILAGKDWRVVEQEEKNQLNRCKKSLEEATQRLTQLEEEYTRCLLTLEGVTANRLHYEKEWQNQEGQLQRFLTPEMPLPQLLQRLAVTEAFLTQEKQQLDALEEARKRAALLVEERRRCYEEQQNQRPPGEQPQQVAQLLENLALREQQLQEQEVQLTLQVQQDDLCR